LQNIIDVVCSKLLPTTTKGLWKCFFIYPVRDDVSGVLFRKLQTRLVVVASTQKKYVQDLSEQAVSLNVDTLL